MSSRPEWWLKVTRRFYHPEHIIPAIQFLKPLVRRVDDILAERNGWVR